MKIVHRDLKSANCLVNKHWTVKICDFGLSRIMTDAPMRDTSCAGTPEWMAPELIRNEPFTEKCDIFSLGVIMWELCTLNRPWEGVPPERVCWHVLLLCQISTELSHLMFLVLGITINEIVYLFYSKQAFA
jgi:serine/threonine protein kinase